MASLDRNDSNRDFKSLAGWIRNRWVFGHVCERLLGLVFDFWGRFLQGFWPGGPVGPCKG